MNELTVKFFANQPQRGRNIYSFHLLLFFQGKKFGSKRTSCAPRPQISNSRHVLRLLSHYTVLGSIVCFTIKLTTVTAVYGKKNNKSYCAILILGYFMYLLFFLNYIKILLILQLIFYEIFILIFIIISSLRLIYIIYITQSKFYWINL